MTRHLLLPAVALAVLIVAVGLYFAGSAAASHLLHSGMVKSVID